MDAEQIKALIEAIKNQDGAAALAIAEAMLVSAASGEEASTEETPADPLESAADPAAEDEEKPAEVATLTARITKLEAERADSVKKLSARVAELESEKASTEKAERVTLVSELVKLGYEIPALAWDGEPEKLQPAKHLASMPIVSLRARVMALSAAGPRATSLETPAREDIELSAHELSLMAKMTDAQKAQFKALRASKRK